MGRGGIRARVHGAAAATLMVVAAATIIAPPVADAVEPVPAQPGAPPKPGGVALTWAPTHMAELHEYTRDEALAIAENHDLVTAAPIAFADHAAAMRAVNPDLTFLAYVNGTLAKPTKVTHLPESAFAHDSAGRRITSPIWGTTLMAPSSPDWRREVDAVCSDRAEQGGYDGCLLDSMGLGVFAPSQKFTGVPANPATGAPYTQAEYRAELAALADSVRAASPDLVHVFNLVENDWRYWRDAVPSRPLALGRPAVQMEDFLRGVATSAAGFPDAEKWLRNVEVIRDLEAGNVTGLITTKLWVDHTDAEAAKWQAFAMASFLMGADGNSYLAFTRSRDRAGAMGVNAPYSMPENIGLPQGPMVPAGTGAYTRTFSNGLAVVNPGTTTVLATLPSRMRRLDGTTVTSVELPPSSGEVLTTVVATDTAPPTGAFTSASGEGGLSLSGTADDDVAVRRVSLAIKRISDGQWLQSDGAWTSTRKRVTAPLTEPGAASTNWSYAIPHCPPGEYRATLIVKDSAGQLNSVPRPRRKVTVQ